MRATAPASASAGNASARSATPQATDAAAGSKSFSDMLVGTPARADAESTPTATGGKPSPKSTLPSSGRSKAASPAVASDSKAPSRSGRTATAGPADAADAANAADAADAAAAMTGTAAGTTDATAAAPAAAASPLPGTTASTSETDESDEADDTGAVLADEDLTYSSTSTGAAAAKPARRASLTDGTASTSLMSAPVVWLMAASSAATSANAAATPPAAPAPAASTESLNSTTALAALTGNAGAADTAPVGSSSTGGGNTAAAAAGTAGTAATAGSFAANIAASALPDFQAVPNTMGTATDTPSSGDSDASGDGAQASPDRPRAATDVSSTDLAGLAQLVRGVAAGNAQTGGIERSIATPVTDPDWSRDMATQVQMMASAKVQSATLRLSPEHLGPVEVHIDMQASQINVNFVAAHPDTRNAIEQSVPTLRAMLAHGGLTLGQTQVQGEARSGSQSGGRGRDNTLPAAGEEPVTVAAVRSAGLIDEYA